MSVEQLKLQAAQDAVDEIIRMGVRSLVVGLGTGSTVRCFIDNLQPALPFVDTFVASSQQSAKQAERAGIRIAENNSVDSIDVYVDGADEINAKGEMIKGGGGAQTGEKILASMAKQFICIADDSKQVETLGNFPVAVEVLPEARSLVAREIVKQFQAQPQLRKGVLTDRGNPLLDVYNLDLSFPARVEDALDCLAGVVGNGIFARRKASLSLLAGKDGVIRTQYAT